jgi:hypothetical protein
MVCFLPLQQARWGRQAGQLNYIFPLNRHPAGGSFYFFPGGAIRWAAAQRKKRRRIMHKYIQLRLPTQQNKLWGCSSIWNDQSGFWLELDARCCQRLEPITFVNPIDRRSHQDTPLKSWVPLTQHSRIRWSRVKHGTISSLLDTARQATTL